VPGGVGSALGLVAGTAAALLGAAVDARDHPVLGLVLLGGTAVGVAGLTTAAGAFAGAVQCWALWDGFLVNRFGELTLTRTSALVLLALAAAALAVAGTGRRLRTRRRHTPSDLRGPFGRGWPPIRPTAPLLPRPPSRSRPGVAHRVGRRASPGR
jgi:hypothetical protein